MKENLCPQEQIVGLTVHKKNLLRYGVSKELSLVLWFKGASLNRSSAASKYLAAKALTLSP